MVTCSMQQQPVELGKLSSRTFVPIDKVLMSGT